MDGCMDVWMDGHVCVLWKVKGNIELCKQSMCKYTCTVVASWLIRTDLRVWRQNSKKLAYKKKEERREGTLRRTFICTSFFDLEKKKKPGEDRTRDATFEQFHVLVQEHPQGSIRAGKVGLHHGRNKENFPNLFKHLHKAAQNGILWKGTVKCSLLCA